MDAPKARDKMVDVLLEAGISRVFTFPGLGITWLAPAFYERRDKIEVILARSEQSASIMAQACVFLCSEKASFITGHTLDVNGGTLMD